MPTITCRQGAILFTGQFNQIPSRRERRHSQGPNDIVSCGRPQNPPRDFGLSSRPDRQPPDRGGKDDGKGDTPQQPDPPPPPFCTDPGADPNNCSPVVTGQRPKPLLPPTPPPIRLAAGPAPQINQCYIARKICTGNVNPFSPRLDQIRKIHSCLKAEAICNAYDNPANDVVIGFTHYPDGTVVVHYWSGDVIIRSGSRF
jgi:hypothetical protein